MTNATNTLFLEPWQAATNCYFREDKMIVTCCCASFGGSAIVDVRLPACPPPGRGPDWSRTYGRQILQYACWKDSHVLLIKALRVFYVKSRRRSKIRNFNRNKGFCPQSTGPHVPFISKPSHDQSKQNLTNTQHNTE